MGLLEFGHPWISHTTFVERRSRTSPWLYAGIYFGSVCVHAGRVLLKSGETLSASLRAATYFKCGGLVSTCLMEVVRSSVGAFFTSELELAGKCEWICKICQGITDILRSTS